MKGPEFREKFHIPKKSIFAYDSNYYYGFNIMLDPKKYSKKCSYLYKL